MLYNDIKLNKNKAEKSWSHSLLNEETIREAGGMNLLQQKYIKAININKKKMIHYIKYSLDKQLLYTIQVIISDAAVASVHTQSLSHTHTLVHTHSHSSMCPVGGAVSVAPAC